MVTGANSGIGLATTRELVRAGARVVMAMRDSSAASHDRVVARALWDRAVELTDVRPDVASSPT